MNLVEEAILRSKQLENTRFIRVLNLGAGVQSTTVYLMAAANTKAFMAGDPLPWPKVGLVDFAVFADTQDEPLAVYKHLEWLKGIGEPEILVRSRGRLSTDLMRGENSSRQRFAAIPAYTWMPGAKREGRTRRQCSKEYKVEVIERTIRRDIAGLLPGRRLPKSIIVEQLVGISLDEAGRFERTKKRRTLGAMRAPLIEMFMTRTHCLRWLEKFGDVPHDVPRSACVFCPFHDDREWLNVKAVPEDWELAVKVDETLRKEGVVVNRNMEADMYVHRSCQPLVPDRFCRQHRRPSRER